MAAAPTPPTPDQLNGIAWAWDAIRDYFGTIFGVSGAGLAWRASGRVAANEAEHAATKLAQENHAERIKALEIAGARTDVTIAALPTRIEMAAYFDRLERRLDQFAAWRQQE